MEPGTDLTACNDETLLLRIAQGDKEAFITAYDRYAADVYAYSMQLIRMGASGRQASEDAQVVLISVFASLWDNRETLSSSLTLIDHLYTNAYNRVVKRWDCTKDTSAGGSIVPGLR